jgi:sugar (pentulose or hexulose) kinase
MARAAVESLAYGLKLASDLAVAEGLAFELLRASGQAAGEGLLCGIKADLLGVPLEVPEIVDCELVGDAAACALAIGDASSLSDGASRLVRIARRFEPSPFEPYAASFASFESALSALERADRSAAVRVSATRGSAQ